MKKLFKKFIFKCHDKHELQVAKKICSFFLDHLVCV